MEKNVNKIKDEILCPVTHMFAVAVSQMWWLMRGKASNRKELKEMSALVIKAVIRQLKFYSRLPWQ